VSEPVSSPSFLYDLPPLRDVIAAFDLRAEKSLGQNFLLDSNITDKIARLPGDMNSATVIEIGPGPGGLTRSLLKAGAAKVIAIEFDPRAVAALQDLQLKSADRLEIIQGDALGIDITAISSAPRLIVANLPYNIATPLLISWLAQLRQNPQNFNGLYLMFQREVADRITASPSTKAYGRLSIMAQWLCDVARVYDLPPSAFTPPPKVSSAIVKFIPKALPEKSPDFHVMEKLVAAAFNQRRKMIRSSLKDYAAELEISGLDSSLRAENLSVDDFITLAMAQN
jgi:16S rRNA (adenine1518-N6/adenine1519-N6)-dimethyltransferase